MKKFGDILRKLLADSHQTHRQFAEAAGISTGTLHAALKAKAPQECSPTTFQGIAKALGITVAELDALWKFSPVAPTALPDPRPQRQPPARIEQRHVSAALAMFFTATPEEQARWLAIVDIANPPADPTRTPLSPGTLSGIGQDAHAPEDPPKAGTRSTPLPAPPKDHAAKRH